MIDRIFVSTETRIADMEFDYFSLIFFACHMNGHTETKRLYSSETTS